MPACSLTLTRTHTEHSSWEPCERAAGCAPKKLQSSLLFLRRSADGMSSRYLLAPLFPHTAFTCCLFLSCSHMDAWRWDMSVSFSSLIHCLISEEMHFSCCYLLNNFKAYSISSRRLIPAEKKATAVTAEIWVWLTSLDWFIWNAHQLWKKSRFFKIYIFFPWAHCWFKMIFSRLFGWRNKVWILRSKKKKNLIKICLS